MQVFIENFFSLNVDTNDVYIISAFTASIVSIFIGMGLIMGIYFRQAKELLALVKHDNAITDPVH